MNFNDENQNHSLFKNQLLNLEMALNEANFEINCFRKEQTILYSSIRKLQTSLQIEIANNSKLKSEIKNLKNPNFQNEEEVNENQLYYPVKYQIKDAMVEFICCLLLVMIFAIIVLLLVAKVTGMYRVLI